MLYKLLVGFGYSATKLILMIQMHHLSAQARLTSLLSKTSTDPPLNVSADPFVMVVSENRSLKNRE